MREHRDTEKDAMAYQLTREQLASITDVELAFGEQRLLPDWSEVPQAFQKGNVYTNLAEAIFFGSKLPVGTIEFREGFQDAKVGEDLQRCVRAHLKSWGPKHEHKIAGVGFMIAQVCEIRVEADKAA
jgi:hypothetical protein